jgi:hypothetical protein
MMLSNDFLPYFYSIISLTIVAAAAIMITHIQDLIMDIRREKKERKRTNYVNNGKCKHNTLACLKDVVLLVYNIYNTYTQSQ